MLFFKTRNIAVSEGKMIAVSREIKHSFDKFLFRRHERSRFPKSDMNDQISGNGRYFLGNVLKLPELKSHWFLLPPPVIYLVLKIVTFLATVPKLTDRLQLRIWILMANFTNDRPSTLWILPNYNFTTFSTFVFYYFALYWERLYIM